VAQFQIDIEKKLGSEFWTNVYQAWAQDLATAQQFAGLIIAAERLIHNTAVLFTRHRVSSVAIGDGIYTVTAVNQFGQRSVGGLLPLFNTLRVDLNAASGRPSRKYYRGVLSEEDISGDAVDTSPFVAFGNELFDLLQTDPMTTGIIDPQQERLTAVIIQPVVQMRQLRRSRRRRTSGVGVFE
jgi:hypothetical protein